MVVAAKSTIHTGDMTPVMQGPVNDTGKEPCSPCKRVWQNCPCHGCSLELKRNLNFMVPSVLKRFRKHLLAVPAGCNVCCVRHSSQFRLGVVVRPLSKREVDSECPGRVIPKLHFCCVIVCDQLTPARRLLGLLLHGRRPHEFDDSPSSISLDLCLLLLRWHCCRNNLYTPLWR